jgi:hypothetical protein
MLYSHAFDCQIVLLFDIKSIWLIISHPLLQDLLQCLRRRPTQVSTLLVRWCCTFATGEPAGLVTDHWVSQREPHRFECHALSLQGNAETLGQLPNWAV